MRAIPGTAFFGAIVLAAILAACGGGGGGGRILPTGGSPSTGGGAPASSKSTRTAIAIRIPPAAQQAISKRRFYVSGSTQAFGVYVALASSAQTPSPANEQIFPVATPSPCAAASGGGEVCTLTVTAPIGEDTFYVAAYATASPGVNATPLSQYGPGTVDVGASPAANATPLNFTLGAVPATVGIVVQSPDPGNTPETQVFPIATPTSASLAITAYDSTGATILDEPTQPFSTPIPITLSPAGEGLKLVQNGTSSCTGTAVASNGGSATIACPADLGILSVAYDGSTHPDSSDHAIDAFVISDASNPSPAPSPANVVLASNVVNTALNLSAEYVSNAFLLNVGGGELLYLIENSGQPEAGTYATASGTASTPVQVNNLYSPESLAVSPSTQTVWAVDDVDGSTVLDCWTSPTAIAGGGSPASFSPTYFNGEGYDELYISGVAVDGSDNVWFIAQDDNSGTAYLGEFAQSGASCTTPSSLAPSNFVSLGSQTPGSNIVGFPNGTGAVAQLVDGGYATATAADLGGSASIASQVTPGSNSQALAIDGAGTAYGIWADTGTLYDLESLSSAGAAALITDLTPSAGVTVNGQSLSANPVALSVFSPSGTTADRAIYADVGFGALGEVGSLGSSPTNELIALPGGLDQPLATAFGSTGQHYVLYAQYSGSSYAVGIARAINTKTWAVPQSTWNVTANCEGYAMFSIDERTDSGSFSLNTGGVPYTVFPGTTPHDFFIAPPSLPATVPVTIMDGNLRSQTVTLSLAVDEGC